MIGRQVEEEVAMPALMGWDACWCWSGCLQVNIIHEYNTRDEIAREVCVCVCERARMDACTLPGPHTWLLVQEGCELMAVPDSRVGAQVIFCK